MRHTVIAALALGVAAAVNPALADCSGEVAQAVQKQGEQKAYRKETNLVGEQGPMTMTVEYQLPDRMHQVVKIAIDPKPFETILVGDKAWTNNGEGWVVASPEELTQLLEYFHQTSGGTPQDVGNFECLGAEMIDGKQLRTYRGLPPTPADEGGSKIGKKQEDTRPKNEAVRMYYLDPANGLPARSIYARPDLLDKPIFKEVYSYSEAIKIEPPASVKTQ